MLDISLALAAMEPDRAGGWIRVHPDRRPTHGAAKASRQTIRPFDAPGLVDKAFQLCQQADVAVPCIASARDYPDGLLIALTVYVAPRSANRAAIEISRHLCRQSDG